MPDHLLLEDGTSLLQEDGASFLLLEDAVAEVNTATWHGVTLSIEIALSASVGESGVWDTATFNESRFGPDIVWNEVAKYCRSFTTNRAFDRDLAAWNAGTATVTLDNRDGRFSPSNLDGPYVTDGITGIRPWRPIRIRATYNSVTYPVFRGYVLAWEESYGGAPFGSVEAVVECPCIDELGHLAGFNGTALAAQGLLEFSGQRINRILNNAGHTGPRAVELGLCPMFATTLAQNAVTELKLTTDSEGGALWIDAEGTVIFQNAYGLIEKERSSTVQAVFGDQTGELEYADCVLAYNGDLVANVVNYTTVGGGFTSSVVDNASRALYGDLSPSTANRTDLITFSPSHLDMLAQFHLATHKDPEQLITSITIKPRRDPDNLFPAVLGLQVRDLIEVIRRPVGGYELDKFNYIAGISHDFDMRSSSWTTQFALWSASTYEDFFTSQWDDGLFDTALFFY